MTHIIKANEASAAVDKNTPTPTEFWVNRREVDCKLKVSFFSAVTCIPEHCTRNANISLAIIRIVSSS